MRLRELGHEPLLSPLLDIVPQRVELPDANFDAVLATSANAFSATVPVSLRDVPVYAVGARTAAAARDAGFADVRMSEGRGAEDLYRFAAAGGARRALHLAGRDIAAAPAPDSLDITRVSAYRAERRPLTDAASEALISGKIDMTLLYSARTAAQFGWELTRLGLTRSRLSVACLAEFGAALSCGWREIDIAERPDERSLFAAAGLLCEDRDEDLGRN